MSKEEIWDKVVIWVPNAIIAFFTLCYLAVVSLSIWALSAIGMIWCMALTIPMWIIHRDAILSGLSYLKKKLG